MADSRLPALTALTTVAAADVFYVVDVSDTTDDASGSSRYVTAANLFGNIGTGVSIGGAMSSTAKNLHIVGDVAIEYGNAATFVERAGSGFIVHRNSSTVPSAIIPYFHVIVQGKGDYQNVIGVSGGYFQARDRSDVATVSISNATNASPIVITSATHPWATGDKVTIQNVGGNTAANGTWTITVTNSTTFSLDGSTGNGAYTSGGTASNKGYLYGLQCSVVPTLARDKVLSDDVVGMLVQHDGAAGTKGTEAIYIGHNANFTSGSPEWIVGFMCDCNADYAFRAGPYTYIHGLRLNECTFTGQAVHIGQGHAIGSRNAANSADVQFVSLNSSDAWNLSTGANNVVFFGTTATATNSGGRVVQIFSDTSSSHPELRVDSNASSGGFADINMFGGSSRSNRLRLLCGGNAGRLYTITNHPLRLGVNATEDVLEITNTTTFTIKDAVNIVVGSTTGTKIGTATTQKLAFWNATPIVQPANTTPTRLALQNLGLVATGGTAGPTVQATVIEYATDVTVGDGKWYAHVPPSLNGLNLVYVHARVITAGTTGTTDIQIARTRSGSTVDMLSTKLTIDSTETGSDTAATAAVINTTNDDVATNDILRIDVDAVSTTKPKGLLLTLAFG